MKSKLKYLALLCSMVMINGCSSGSSSEGSPSLIDEDEVRMENPVRLSELGVFPASENSSLFYLAQLTNYSLDKYTLLSARAVDLDTGNDSSLVSIVGKACSVLSPKGGCSLQITPNTAKSADVGLEVKLKDPRGEIITVRQLIRISSELSGNDIQMLNDNSRLITEDGYYSLSIPVFLGRSFDEVRVSNGSLNCNNGNSFEGACTYTVEGKLASDNAIISTSIEGINNGEVVDKLDANTLVEVGKNAHLLLSRGIAINYPQESGEITLFNSGNTVAKNIQIKTDDKNLGISSTCNEVKGGEFCKAKVSVTGNINGIGSVKVDYKDGETNYGVSTNVSYKVSNAQADLELKILQPQNFQNAIFGGKERRLDINVTNKGNRPIDSLQYYIAPYNNDFKLVAGTGTSCNLSQNSTLAVGASCTLSMTYKPSKTANQNTINIVANGIYKNELDREQQLVQSNGVSYSASEVSSSNLTWSKTSGSDNLVIGNNGTDKAEAIWKLTNSIAKDEGIPAILNDDVKLSKTITALSVSPVKAGSCAKGYAIEGQDNCEYKVSYGPVSDVLAKTDVNLVAKFKLANKADLTNNSQVIQVEATQTKPVLTATVSIKDSPDKLTGTGTNSDPWKFTTVGNKAKMVLQYKFTNSGVDVSSFNVNAGGLPSGAEVEASTCPIGSTTGVLKKNETCTVDVVIPDPKILEFPNDSAGDKLNGANLSILLPYSYSQEGKIRHRDGSDLVKYVSFSRMWATPSHETVSFRENGDSIEVDVKTSATIGKGLGVSYPIKVTPVKSNWIENASECTIASEQAKSCISTIKVAKSKFIGDSRLNVGFSLSAGGAKAENINTSHSLKIGYFEVYTQEQLVQALNSDINNRVIALGTDLALSNWMDQDMKGGSFTIDGKNHKITGLTTPLINNFNGISNDSNIVIKNLELTGNVTSTKDANAIGLLASFLSDNKNYIMTNLKLHGSIVTDKIRIGALVGAVGYYARESYQDIYSDVEIKSSLALSVGGLIGYDTGGELKAKNISIIVANLSAKNEVGGIVGLAEKGSVLIDTAIVKSKITSDSRSGGVIGKTVSPTVNITNIRTDIEFGIVGNKEKPSLLVGGVIGQIQKSSAGSSTTISKAIINNKFAPSKGKDDDLNFGGVIGGTLINGVNIVLSQIEVSSVVNNAENIKRASGVIVEINTIESLVLRDIHVKGSINTMNAIPANAINAFFIPASLLNLDSSDKASISINKIIDEMKIGIGNFKYIPFSGIGANSISNNIASGSKIYYLNNYLPILMPSNLNASVYTKSLEDSAGDKSKLTAALTTEGFDVKDIWDVLAPSVVEIRETGIPQFPK